MFSRVTSFRFSGMKGNTGKGFRVQGEISSKSEANWVSSSVVQGTERVQSLSSPDWRKICTSMRTSDQKPPRNPSRWELKGPAHQLGNGETGLTEAITRWKEQGCNPRGRGGRRSLGQGGPIDTRVVEGTVVLIAAVALHHEMSAHRAV